MSTSTIYKKLQEARVKLQSTQINKTGLNSHSKQQYFSLGDFLPAIQAIFNDIGLCGVISFTTEIAELNIYDVSSDAKITITSPMADASLKSATPVQNLGAIQTYLRRYLWVTAMEIVEHDILDSATGKVAPPAKKFLDPSQTDAWSKAVKSLKSTKSLDLVLKHMDITDEHQQQLKVEADAMA